MGKPCVVGCADLAIEAAGRRAQLAGAPLEEGDWLTIDGGTGAIFPGRCVVAVEQPEAELAEIARWRRSAAVHA